MKADVFEYEGEGIQCVYDNKKWVVCIKNWKPNNDIEKIQYLAKDDGEASTVNENDNIVRIMSIS